jgi:omega-6 fatty acid desaturase (delta-12 desaturase)
MSAAAAPSTIRQRPGQPQKDTLIAQATLKQQSEEAAAVAAGKVFVPPTYTIKQLLDAIPAHCYQRSALKSSQYIVQDFIAIGCLVWASFQTDGFVASL